MPLWSPFDPSHTSDPHRMYARLREEAPVLHSQTGEFVVTRYKDVKSILKSSDYRAGNRLEWLTRSIAYLKNRDEDLGNIYKAVNTFILFLNPPDHQVIRSFVSKTWDDRDVETMVHEVVHERLASLSGSFDVVKDYAQPIPAIVACRIMGIPLEDFEYLRALGTNMVRALDLYQTWKDLVELNETSTQFVKYFSDLIARRPKNGLLGKLIAANDREKVLNEQQMISIAIFLFIAGEETIAASISTSLHDFIQRPQLYQSIRSNRQILRTTGMDEFFRFNGPVHLLGRISKVDVVVDGVLIPADSPITLALASANRDPRQFADPDNIDLRRSPNPHLSFGYGTHFCLGEWLGKLQTTIATEKFISKFSAARVETKNIEWMQNIAVRGMTSLIVTANE